MQLSIDKISDFFPLHRPEVLKNFLTLVHLICQNKTCNIFKLADHAKGNIKFDSSYKKFIRFFKIKSISEFTDGISLMLFHFCLSLKPKYLIIDRTNWEKGNKMVNILTLGFELRKKVFIPIYWVDLDKPGNSPTKARIDILNKLKSLYEACKLDIPPLTLLADREFIGEEWFTWLTEQKIGFTVRLRSKNYLHHWKNELDTVCEDILLDITNHLKKNKYFSKKMVINGNAYYFSAQKTLDKDDPYLFLLSTCPEAQQSSAEYQIRWGIEVFFKHIKTNGFNMEDVNFKKSDKIELMFGIVTLCYTLVIQQGYKIEEERGILLKYSKGKSWKAKSLFRTGLTEILKLITSVEQLIQHIKIFIKSFKILII